MYSDEKEQQKKGKNMSNNLQLLKSYRDIEQKSESERKWQ